MSATPETHLVTLTKFSKRNLQEPVVISNAQGTLDTVNTKTRARMGWKVSCSDKPSEIYQRNDSSIETHQYIYTLFLTVTYDGTQGKPSRTVLPSILRAISDTAARNIMGRWTLSTVDGRAYIPATDEDLGGSADDSIGYAEVNIPENWQSYFSHLYGLAPHIERVMKAISVGIESGWKKRFSTALIGPPGCGKSEICEVLQAMLGNDAVMKYDATATTAAGAIKQLSELDILPRIVVVEEGEKSVKEALTFLLSVLDIRGEIRKVTARGEIQRNTRLLVIMTVNDEEMFRGMMAGALASRLPNKVYFQRPPREVVAQILQREIADVDGDLAWIDPVLKYCDDHPEDPDIMSPRQIIAHCLLGGDGWLDGSYQDMLSATAPHEPKFVGEADFTTE